MGKIFRLASPVVTGSKGSLGIVQTQRGVSGSSSNKDPSVAAAVELDAKKEGWFNRSAWSGFGLGGPDVPRDLNFRS